MMKFMKAAKDATHHGTSASTHRSDPHHNKPSVALEPTYRTEPDNMISSVKLRQALREVIEPSLRDETYDSGTAKDKAKELAEKVKQRVKMLGFNRYKFVCLVTIGENGQGGSIHIGSQCVGHDKFDTHADFTYKNTHLYAVGTVYGCYVE